jgi:predicted dehydrogenase
MQRKALGIAVVGSGRIVTLRARLAAKHPAVGFLAVSDLDPARALSLAEQTGADFCSADNNEIISRPEVNAVFVSTPEGEHAAPVRKALELGNETRAWLDHLATGSPTVHTTPGQARINLETTIAIQRAAASGKPIRLPLEI